MIFETNIKEITDSLFDDIQKMLIEKAIKDYAKLKCQELLEIIADDMGNGSWYVNEYRILENFNLDEFIQ